MTRTATILALLVILAFSAAPAAAASHPTPSGAADLRVDFQEGEEQEEDGGGSSFTDAPGSGWSAAVIWSLVALIIVSAVLGFFYFMKRQVGGFPENPSWVAPITIMPSRDFPDEGDFGDEPAAPAHH